MKFYEKNGTVPVVGHAAEEWRRDRILQIMPAAPGSFAVFTDDDSEYRVPLVGWALVQEEDRETITTRVTGLCADGDGPIDCTDESTNFVRFEVGPVSAEPPR